MQENKTIHALRKNIYQMHNWDMQNDCLVRNDRKIMESKKLMEQFKKNYKQEPAKQIKLNTDTFSIIRAAENIALYVTLLTQKDATQEDVDNCLEIDEYLWNLTDPIDYLMSVSVSAIFCIDTNGMRISEITNLIILTTIKVGECLHNNKKNKHPQDTLVCEKVPDISKLKIGCTVKNYKVLCELLGEEYKSGGKVRNIQLKNFKRYFDWEKIGQKFIITDIYDTPLPKSDKRGGNNSKYVKCIELILLNHLSKQEGYTNTLCKKDWWLLLGMVNSEYKTVSENEHSIKKLKELDPSITSYEIKHFFQRSNKKLQEILFSALNSLSSRKLIDYEVQTVIVDLEEDGKKEYRIATDNEKKQVLHAERYVLHNMFGFEKMFQIFCRFKQKEYYRLVTERLSMLYGWDHYYKQIKIIYTKQDVIEAIPTIENELKRIELNEKVINVLEENASAIYRKQKMDYEEKNIKLFQQYADGKDISNSEKIWECPSTYLYAQSLLTNELIKLGHQKMQVDIKNINLDEVDDVFLLDK